MRSLIYPVLLALRLFCGGVCRLHFLYLLSRTWPITSYGRVASSLCGSRQKNACAGQQINAMLLTRVFLESSMATVPSRTTARVFVFASNPELVGLHGSHRRQAALLIVAYIADGASWSTRGFFDDLITMIMISAMLEFLYTTSHVRKSVPGGTPFARSRWSSVERMSGGGGRGGRRKLACAQTDDTCSLSLGLNGCGGLIVHVPGNNELRFLS